MLEENDGTESCSAVPSVESPNAGDPTEEAGEASKDVSVAAGRVVMSADTSDPSFGANEMARRMTTVTNTALDRIAMILQRFRSISIRPTLRTFRTGARCTLYGGQGLSGMLLRDGLGVGDYKYAGTPR